MRGGQDQFDWEDVKLDKHRESYLGEIDGAKILAVLDRTFLEISELSIGVMFNLIHNRFLYFAPAVSNKQNKTNFI